MGNLDHSTFKSLTDETTPLIKQPQHIIRGFDGFLKKTCVFT